MPQYLRPPQAAAFLRNNFGFGAPRTLAKLRVLGGGPAYRKIGRLVVYEPNDLIAWAKDRLGPRQHSTSETPQRGNEYAIESNALGPPQRLISEASPKRAAELGHAEASAK
jgi:hypothetical protein